MIKKFVSGLILFSIITGAMAFPLRTKAIFGLADITINPEGVVGWITDVVMKGLDITYRALLETLKKRLLDTIVDEIIKWIQGDTGKPRFVTDFGSVFRDSYQAAIGDTLQEIGLARLCSPFNLRIQLQLQQPVFSQQVTCTLDQVIGNIEQFRNNFRTGGWIGYYELLKPQNNRWGVEILTYDEVVRKRSEKQQATSQETQASKGFLSVKRCLEWTLVEKTNQKPVPAGGEILLVNKNPIGPGDPGYSNAPSTPPPLNASSGIHQDSLDVTKVQWKCTKDEVTTPGTAIATGLDKALYSDLDFIANAEELQTYLAAILDAAINRLIKEGVEGVQALTTGEAREAEKQTANCDSLSTQAARDDCRKYMSNVDEQKRTADEQLNKLLEQQAELAKVSMTNLRSNINEAITLNNRLASSTQELVTCQQNRNLNCTQNPTLESISQRGETLNNLLAQLNQLEQDLNSFKNTSFPSTQIKKAILEQLTKRINDFINQNQSQISGTLSQIENELEKVKNELSKCRDISTAYACPT